MYILISFRFRSRRRERVYIHFILEISVSVQVYNISNIYIFDLKYMICYILTIYMWKKNIFFIYALNYIIMINLNILVCDFKTWKRKTNN